MNKLKQSLKQNKVSFGTWIQIPHPAIIEIIANTFSTKLDWMCIDMEHGVIDIESMTNLIRTIEKYNITPLVRIPKNDYIWIHRSLDAGAKGLIIPMIKNGEEAKNAIDECKYPPEGKRSFGYSRSNGYGQYFDNCCLEDNDDIPIILQIEHIEAINNLDEILKSPNMDGTFIGPLDLAGSMGLSSKIEMEGRFFLDTLDKYRNKSFEFNVPTGIHIIHPDKEKIDKAQKDGYKIIALGLDTVFLSEKCRDILKYL